MTPNRLLVAALVAAPLLASASPVRAAASYDACKAFITTLPATISTQGVWCLNKDVATSLASGVAITITTSNVTLDCNGFKIGGLSAGTGTNTIGVLAEDQSNVTVRDCNIRGFATAVALGGEFAGGHRVEDNRFEFNTMFGVLAYGPGSVIRGNTIVDTGGTTSAEPPNYTVGAALFGRTDFIDNQVSGVDGTTAVTEAGIGVLTVYPDGNVIAGNRIGGIAYGAGGTAIGIGSLTGGPLDIRGNTIAGGMPGMSVACASTNQYLYANALMMGEPNGSCADGGENYGLTVAP